jgi:hypothetical protein
MAMEKGKERPAGPASRETDPRDLETSAAVSGDNDIDRIITQPDEEAKKETDEAYFNKEDADKAEKSNRDVKE